MGVWALKQIAALIRQGAEVQVVSMMPWLPKSLGSLSPKFQSWTVCPAEFQFDNVHALYPRWLYYQFGRLKRWDFVRPALQHEIAWWSVRRRLLRLTRQFAPDVIYAHHTWMNGDLAYRLHKVLGIPYIVTDHDFDEIDECGNHPARWRYFDRIFRNASCLSPISKRMEQSIQRLFPGTRTIVNHNGADPLPASYSATPRPPELKDKIIALCVGMFYRRKNVALLIRAFDRIAAKHPQAILRIVGDGTERAGVDAAHAAATHKDQIQLLGMRLHEQVLQEMAWADLFALVGVDEPWGVVYTEAMFAKLPIVCCNDGGINDVLVNDVHGLSIPPNDEAAAADALDRLLGDAELRERLGENARQLAEGSLSWDANAMRLIPLLEKAAAERSQHA
jgi:glycosyltransferase involved in cell wall biosynthesis